MKTKKLKKIIREAFQAGNRYGSHQSYFDKPDDEDEYIASIFHKEKEEEEEERIPITLASIKAICGWSKYCDITGGNHWMMNEFSVEDSEIFYVKKSHAKELNLI